MTARETVFWHCKPDEGVDGYPTEIVIDAVDIPTMVQDENLRHSLQRQREYRDKNLGQAVVPFAFWPSGNYSHTVYVSRRSLVEYANFRKDE